MSPIGHQVDLAGLDAQGLGVLVRDDRNGELVEVRQPDAVGITAPVPIISSEDHPLTRDVFVENEWTEAGDGRQRRARFPLIPERPRVERGFQLVFRQDRDAGEES